MSISRAAPLALVLLALWTVAGWAQQSEAATERELARLLGRSFSASAVDENGWTDLHHAAVLNLPRLAAALLDAGAEVDAALKNDHETLGVRLHVVLRSFQQDGFASVVRVGQTPLHLVAREGSYEVAKLLLDRGADPNHRNGEGNTPLHLAVHRWQVVEALLEAGADPNLRNAANRRPGDLATHPVSLVLLGETWPRAPEVEIIRKIDNGLCNSFSKNDFSRLQMRLKNSTRRSLGREMPFEEAYFHLRCNHSFTTDLDLLHLSAEIPVRTQRALRDLLAYLIADAHEKELLGKIVSCRREVGERGCLNVLEHIETNIESSSRDSFSRIKALKEFRQILDLNLDYDYDQAFCRQFLEEPLHCSGE